VAVNLLAIYLWCLPFIANFIFSGNPSTIPTCKSGNLNFATLVANRFIHNFITKHTSKLNVVLEKQSSSCIEYTDLQLFEINLMLAVRTSHDKYASEKMK